MKAYEHFADPEWDGDPEGAESPPPGKPAPKPRPEPETPTEPTVQVKVKMADGKDREITHTASTTFWNQDGQQVTAQEFLEQLFGELPKFFTDEYELRRIWSSPITRQQLLVGLAERGFTSDQLRDMQRLIEAERSDLFDVLAYVRFATPPRSRAERAVLARASIQADLPEQQRAFVEFVLEQYVAEGVEELAIDKLPLLLELRYGGISDAVDKLVIDAATIHELFSDFQQFLYEEPLAS